MLPITEILANRLAGNLFFVFQSLLPFPAAQGRKCSGPFNFRGRYSSIT